MEQRKRWQKFLILGVLALTVYNILPTVFFYSKPLKNPIDEKRAESVVSSITSRVNGLESESKAWLQSYCKLLGIKVQNIHFTPKEPTQYTLHFKDEKEAHLFQKHLKRAGNLIPFVPAQLSPHKSEGKVVVVQRKIPLHFTAADQKEIFQFSKKFEGGAPTPLYQSLVNDRALSLALAVGGSSEKALLLQNLFTSDLDEEAQNSLLLLSQEILSASEVFGESSPITGRFYASFSQIPTQSKSELIQNFISLIERAKDQVKLERITLQSQEQSLRSKGQFLDTIRQQRLEQLQHREKVFTSAETLVKNRKNAFSGGKTPWTEEEVMAFLGQKQEGLRQVVDLEGRNPFIRALEIDWVNQALVLHLYDDVAAIRKSDTFTSDLIKNERATQFIYNEIALDSRRSGEKISPAPDGFQVHLSDLTGSQSFLAMELGPIAKARAQEIYRLIKENWHPKTPDLKRENFPIWDLATYEKLPASEKTLGLLVYAPAEKKGALPGLKNHSIYVIAKGLDRVLQQFGNQELERGEFFKEFNDLRTLLQQEGLFGYPGSTLTHAKEFSSDFVFEGEDYFQNLLKATRENFSAHGTKKYAVLELSNVEQRILAENRIADQMHEDLLKWRDDYYAAQVGIGGASRYDVPKPTKSPFWDNMSLSFSKFFRGDDRKILHWGLDLSGGKTVQIEMRDASGNLVTREDDIKQGINELYSRVNKMGVSEVSIRQEGNFITLDFPGSQNLSAAELIKASTMYFHIVNEKFNNKNPQLAAASDQFLQDIWNEAVVTGKRSIEEINQIAWKHIHGDSYDPEVLQPRSEAAKILHENGLRLASPLDKTSSNLFSDATSQIALLRGDDYTEWYGKTNPLLVVFRNYALEGSNLSHVQSGYDQSRGNFLGFEIKGKETLKSGEKINPRDDLHAWTSQFSKDKIAGTPNGTYSQEAGWRMAVILNGSVITAPTLSFAISDKGQIEGSFTQREVTKLEADLKAGSLSFTPHILSEKNVSPEVGAHERTLGIIAMGIALGLVILTMIGYYRFAGWIASIAVTCNLFIMWATLQNINATLTFASIAGVILSLGMAVDANVLVFERIREEFKASGRIGAAIHAGYKKAFWAIFDSNLTTIIAAIILLQFDSGPIRGFALTLIIGIVSSMFTALFMTRFFFTGWVQNTRHKELKMSQLIKSAKFDFLKYAKLAFAISGIIVIAGGVFFIKERNNILGMDFTGGYSLTCEVEKAPSGDLRSAMQKALIAGGASPKDFSVRELSGGSQMRLFLGKVMQQPGHPFHGMPLEKKIDSPQYSFETNPRISWIVDQLNASSITLTPDSLSHLENEWSEISGQLSDSMRNSALIGLAVALAAILLYITFRFEFKYAISATICIAHDVAITLGAIALLNALKIPMQIDLNTVAALMTIVGYSLNDTIIIFDRIREDLRFMRKASFREIITHALNVTLSRTLMTSGTTLAALIPLVALGGSAVFGFALVMTLGVVFGTMSSLFIAAPLLHFFHARAAEKEKMPQVV